MTAKRSRLTRTLTSALAGAALLGAAGAGSAHPAATQTCRGILILETITVLADTDPDDQWPHPDKWNYHVYSKQNGKKARTGFKVFTGDTGKVAEPNLVVSSKIVGDMGDPVTLWLEQWSSERDPDNGRHGIPPADQRNNENPFHWERETPRTCEPGDETFTTIVDVPDSQDPDVPGEHDGRLQYDWLWRFVAEAD